MKKEKLEKKKKKKSLTGTFQICSACSQTCDKRFGERHELGRGVCREKIKAKTKGRVQRRNGDILKMKGGVNLRKWADTERVQSGQ